MSCLFCEGGRFSNDPRKMPHLGGVGERLFDDFVLAISLDDAFSNVDEFADD